MAAFEAGGEKEPDGAGLMGKARLLTLAFPYRALQARRHAAAHQGVPAGVEIHLVDAIAGAIMGSEFRHRTIGDAGQILGFGRGHELAHRFKIDAKRTRHVSRDVLQQGIGTIGIVPGKGRALIVGLGAKGLNRAHRTSLTGIRTVLHGDIAYFRTGQACPCPRTFL